MSQATEVIPPQMPAETRRWSLPGLLRAVGAGSLLVSGLVFLVEGWSDTGLLQRSLCWGGLTLALTVLALLALKRFHDALGARWLLGLAAATVPLHFAVIGSGVWDRWFAPDVTTRPTLSALAVAGGVAAALLPVLHFALRALVRDKSRLLLGLLFGFSAPLVLPLRSGEASVALVTAELLVLLAFELGFLRTEPKLQHPEGRAMRRLLLVPIAVTLGRSYFHDASNPWWQAALLGAPAVCALCEPVRRQLSQRLTDGLQAIGALGLLASVLLAQPTLLGGAFAVAVVCSLVALVLRSGASALLLLALLATFVARGAIFLEGEQALSFVCVGLALCVGAIAFVQRRARPAVAALLSAVLLLVLTLVHYLAVPLQHGWLAFAALGAALLLGASTFESQKARYFRLREAARAHFHG